MFELPTPDQVVKSIPRREGIGFAAVVLKRVAQRLNDESINTDLAEKLNAIVDVQLKAVFDELNTRLGTPDPVADSMDTTGQLPN